MIYNQIIDDEIENTKDERKININSNIYKYIVILLMSLILSPISIENGINPICFAMLGVSSVFGVPLILVFITSVVSMLFTKVSSDITVCYSIFFAVYSLVTVLLNINGASKKYAVLIKLIISIMIIKLVQVIFMSYSLSNMIIYLSSIVSFYLIFVHGTSVILNIKKGFVYTEEEKISALCVIALFLTLICNVKVFSISFANIFAIMIVLMYGYKNGAISGCVAGFIIGLTICIVSGSNVSFIVTLASGGLIAGIMNKIGKTATVIGFLISSALISYFTSEFAYYTASIVEIVIASIPVLVIPKSIQKKIDSFFNLNNSLDTPYSNLLDSSKVAQDKLNAISDMINDVASMEYEITKEDKIELREIVKKYILDYIKNSDISQNSYTNIIEDEKLDITADYISSKLENSDSVDEDMILIDLNNKKQLIENLQEIYSNIKLMRLLKRKELQLHKKCNDEYKELSGIISNLASEVKNKLTVANTKDVKEIRDELKLLGYVVYEDEFIVNNNYFEYTFITDILVDIDKQKKEIVDAVSTVLNKNMTVRLLLNISKTEKSKVKLASITQYMVDTGISKVLKQGEQVSGDSHLCMSFGNNKYLSVLSDGAGSGIIANSSSKNVISTLEKLIKAGFDENKATEIVNKIIKLKQDENCFASLDIAIFDLDTATSNFIKFGAAPTYILSEGKVTSINSMNIPVGLINDSEYVPIVKKLNNFDLVVQISDGALLGSNNMHDNYFTQVLSKVDCSSSSNDIAVDIINKLTYDKTVNDDITVVVNKVIATQSIK